VHIYWLTRTIENNGECGNGSPPQYIT